jgi:hypothetical protein
VLAVSEVRRRTGGAARKHHHREGRDAHEHASGDIQ